MVTLKKTSYGNKQCSHADHRENFFFRRKLRTDLEKARGAIHIGVQGLAEHWKTYT